MKPELKIDDVKGKTVDQVVRYYWPDLTDEQIEYRIWEETCFPMSIEKTLEQLYALYQNKLPVEE